MRSWQEVTPEARRPREAQDEGAGERGWGGRRVQRLSALWGSAAGGEELGSVSHPPSPRFSQDERTGLRGRLEVGAALEAEGVGSNAPGPRLPEVRAARMCRPLGLWGVARPAREPLPRAAHVRGPVACSSFWSLCHAGSGAHRNV